MGHVASGRGVRDETRRRRSEIIVVVVVVVVVVVECYCYLIVIIVGKPGLADRLFFFFLFFGVVFLFCLFIFIYLFIYYLFIYIIFIFLSEYWLFYKSLMLTFSKPLLFPREELCPANPAYCCCAFSWGEKRQFLHFYNFKMHLLNTSRAGASVFGPLSLRVVPTVFLNGMKILIVHGKSLYLALRRPLSLNVHHVTS